LNHKSPIAVLLFSRSASADARKKRIWSGSFFANLQLFNQLIACTRQKVADTGMPIFHFGEWNQRGQTFGERLTNAIHDVFELGYQSVIVVGNDTPDLSAHDLCIAQDALLQGRNVVGFTHEGGAYLIGLSREYFEKDTLRGLAWQTAELGSELRTFFDKEEYVELDEHHELNKVVSVYRWFRSMPKGNALAKRIFSAMCAVDTSFSLFNEGDVSDANGRIHGFRGPPVFRVI
jgi:hypothetical protein